MTLSQIEALEFWQAKHGLLTERRLNDLRDAVDDLTTLAKSREGVQTIRANYSTLVESLKKMHDLVIEFRGVAQ